MLGAADDVVLETHLSEVGHEHCPLAHVAGLAIGRDDHDSVKLGEVRVWGGPLFLLLRLPLDFGGLVP